MPPKPVQRLEYSRLAEALVEQEMVEPDTLNELLANSRPGATFADAVVSAGLVADWELSRVVCEVYGLPFLTVAVAHPDPRLLDGMDRAFLLQSGIVPIARHGKVLTVLMPGMVTSEVLAALGHRTGMSVLPVVGTVETNRAWLAENCAAEPAAALPAVADHAPSGPVWSSIFDAADAAVLLDLGQLPEEETG